MPSTDKKIPLQARPSDIYLAEHQEEPRRNDGEERAKPAKEDQAVSLHGPDC